MLMFTVCLFPAGNGGVGRLRGVPGFESFFGLVSCMHGLVTDAFACILFTHHASQQTSIALTFPADSFPALCQGLSY